MALLRSERFWMTRSLPAVETETENRIQQFRV